MIDIPNLCSLAREDIGVTSIQNSHGGTSEELTASSTELNVVTGEVVNLSLGQHGVVLELRLAERRGVSGNDDELGLSRSELLESRLVSEGDLSGLHNKCQTTVDGVGGLLSLLSCWCHLCGWEIE